MAIYGVGAYYDKDVSQDFIEANLIGVGWPIQDAPELHEFIAKLKPGDVVYIKSYPPSSSDIIVKAVGIIKDEMVLNSEVSSGLVEAGRNVAWLDKQEFRVPKPKEKNNVRNNTLYEEHHPMVRKEILNRFISRLHPPSV